MGDEANHYDKVKLDELNNLLFTTPTNLNENEISDADKQLSKILPNLYLCGEYAN